MRKNFSRGCDGAQQKQGRFMRWHKYFCRWQRRGAATAPIKCEIQTQHANDAGMLRQIKVAIISRFMHFDGIIWYWECHIKVTPPKHHIFVDFSAMFSAARNTLGTNACAAHMSSVHYGLQSGSEFVRCCIHNENKTEGATLQNVAINSQAKADSAHCMCNCAYTVSIGIVVVILHNQLAIAVKRIS